MSGILKKIKSFFGMAGKKNGHFSYELPQKYAVSFSAEIKNNASEIRSCAVVLPIPFSGRYQGIRGDILCVHEGNFRGTDVVYNNKYVWWRVRVAPRSKAVFQENFNVLVKPFSVSLDSIVGKCEEYAALERKFTDPYLRGNSFINGDDPKIRKIAEDVVGKEKRIIPIISCLNEYVISRLTYGNPLTGLYSVSDALTKDKVDCGGFAVLLGSLLIASGIPARIVSGFFAGYSENSMHAWLEAMAPDGTWIPLDPSMEKLSREGKTKKSGMRGFVGSDRIALSVGCDIPLTIDGKNVTVDILQNPVLFAEGSGADFSVNATFFTSTTQEVLR